MSAIQKAVLVEDIGKPVKLGTREVPSPGEKQVLVRVTATMLLPHDAYGRDWGLIMSERLPAVPGSNVVGVIERVGAGVTFKIGERVFGISWPDPISSDQAGLQEYAVLNANAIGRIPVGFSDEQVATLPINIVTSCAVLFTKTGFDIPAPFAQQGHFDYASISILIIGGGTNVGQVAVQLARIAGVGKIVVIAGSANEERLKAIGATHVLDRHESPQKLKEQFHTIVGPDGFTHVYNCAHLNVDLAIAAVSASKPSTLRLLLPLEGHEEEEIKLQRPLCDARFVSDLTNESLAPHCEQFWATLPQWLEEKKILTTGFKVIQGLDKVDKINEALDGYLDLARPGPQAVVCI